MGTITTPAERHVHLDLDVDRERHFHYRSQGHDGHRVILHRGDSVTFTCGDEFSIRFDDLSPFEDPVLHSRHCFLTAHVKSDALPREYEYTVEVEKGDDVIVDSDAGPEIVIEAT